MLSIFLIGAPMVVVVITGIGVDHWITPFATSVVVMGFWSLNEMAKELENPFGDDTNDVPIVNGHERFVEALTQLFYAEIPRDQQFVPPPPAPPKEPPPPPTPPPAAAAASASGAEKAVT